MKVLLLWCGKSLKKHDLKIVKIKTLRFRARQIELLYDFLLKIPHRYRFNHVSYCRYSNISKVVLRFILRSYDRKISSE